MKRVGGFPRVNFCYILISSSFFFEISIAIDTITPAQSISDGQFLVSSGQIFELGFFSPGNSKNRYLGIWFKNISPPTIVWVANRDNPLSDSSGILKIDKDGNLALYNNRTESVVWSATSSSKVEDPLGILLDSGNFVLRDEINILWQSFDYPSDTQLSGMKIGWDLKTGLNRYLTSWKSEEDPSHGDFTFSLNIHGLPELVILNRSVKFFRSGPWNGLRFSGVLVKPYPLFIPKFVSNAEEVYFTFETVDKGYLIKRTVNYSGSLQRFRWDDESQKWVLMYTRPSDECDKYGKCGVNSICKANYIGFCECLNGFRPKSQKEWDLLNWNKGCVRKSAQICGMNDGFVELTRVKVPDLLKFWLNKQMSRKECEKECLRNCSCVAYANSDISNGGSGCLLWFGDLIDIRELNEEYTNQYLYIRLPASELESSAGTNKKKVLVVVAVAVAVAIFVAFAMLILYRIIWKKRQRGEVINNKEIDNIHRSGEQDLELPLFDLITIEAATDNFSIANKIGEGGFGPVYKGKLSTGQDIAVKRLSESSRQGLREFKNEVILIEKLQHRNLVRLLGCCIQGAEMMLVYEYMPNKSLNSFIFNERKSTSLNWEKRFNIIVGIARGLLYLHRDSRLRIIHRDLKASNILLDVDMNAKISDFGMARILGGDHGEAKTRRVVGTYGYMSPEYAVDGLFSMKSDVFSFGVLVLEIVSRKKNRGFHHPDHELSLLGHAWNLWNEGRALDLIDAVMEEDSYPKNEVLKCIQVSLLCVQQRREDRPMMSSVVLMLDNENMMLPQPKKPGFYIERSPTEIDSSSAKEQSDSKYAMSVTLSAGR